MKMCHDFELSGHLGTAKTAELVKRYFYWNNIDAAVREYVLSCPYCQADEDTNQRKLGLLQSIEIPSRRWQVVTVDFFTALPEVNRDRSIYDSIWSSICQMLTCTFQYAVLRSILVNTVA